jgi:hypothetical protein
MHSNTVKNQILKCKYLFNNDRTVSAIQEINGFSFTNTHRFKQFGGYFRSMGRRIIRDLLIDFFGKNTNFLKLMLHRTKFILHKHSLSSPTFYMLR